jgi:outer membrane protein assembly factor BamB
MVCLKTKSGKEIWRKSFAGDFGGKMMTKWGYSESPLVDGDRVLCTPGGPDAVIVAMDKKTGEVLWKSAVPDIGERGIDGAGYGSIVAADICGIRQYLQIVGRGMIGVAAGDGRFLWGYNRIANNIANIPNAVVDGNHVFCTTSYKTGSALLELSAEGGGIKAREVYFLGPDEFENHHGGVILLNGYLYGGCGQNKGVPVCLEMKTGKIAWKADPPGKRSVAMLYADGHLYMRYESGLMVLAEANPRAFKVKGSFEIPTTSGPSWPHPVIHGGILYLRDHEALLGYDISL